MADSRLLLMIKRSILQKYRIVLAPETEVRELTNDGLLCHRVLACYKGRCTFSHLFTHEGLSFDVRGTYVS